MNLRRRGFTLIEVLVAMAVFAIMSAFAYATLGRTLDRAEDLNESMDRLQAIQRTMRYLVSDLSSAAPRPVRDELGDSYQPAVFISAENLFALAVTHGGWPNPGGLPRSTLQRSIYQLEEDRLLRMYQTVLDATYSSSPITTELLDGVESLSFRMLDDNDRETYEWPPPGASGLPALIMRPRAVEIILTLEDEGEIRRIVEVAS